MTRPVAWEWTCDKSKQTRTLNQPPRGKKALSRWVARPLYDQAALDAAVAAERESWRAVVAHAVKELREVDDETAQIQAAALQGLL